MAIKIDENTLSNLWSGMSSAQIDAHNKEVNGLIKNLSKGISEVKGLPKEKRTPEVIKAILEQPINAAYVKVTRAVDKDALTELTRAANPVTRAYWAIDLLQQMFKKTKGKGSGKEETQQVTAPAIPTGGTGTTPLPQQGTPTKKLTDADLKATDTTQLPQTGQTVNLNPRYTQSLEESDQPESDKAATGQTTQLSTGDTTKLATGETRRLDTQKLSEPPGGSAATGVTEDLSGKVIYSGASVSTPYVSASKKADIAYAQRKPDEILLETQKEIDATVREELAAIERGERTEITPDELHRDPGGVARRVRTSITQEQLQHFSFRHPQIAKQFESQIPQLKETREQTEALHNELRKRKLLDENNPIPDDPTHNSVTGLYPLNLQIWQQVPRYSTLKPEEHRDLGVKTRIDSLRSFADSRPNLIPQYDVLKTAVSKKTDALKKEAVTRLAKTELGKKIVQGGASIAAKKAGGAVAARGIAQLIGSFVPGIGNAAAFLITEALSLAKKLLSKLSLGLFTKIKENGRELAGGGLTLLGGGLLLGNIFAGAAGVGLLGLSLAGGGPAALAAGTAAGIAAFTALLGTILVTFVTSIVVSIIGVILLTAFIFLIINNSGYVTPFSPDGFTTTYIPSTSLGIEVHKTALPKVSYTNNELPITVTYRIEIKALKEDLTDISYDNAYTITQNPTVASPPSVTLPDSSGTIAAGQTRTVTYTVTYGAEFKDASVCDNFRVSATTGGGRDTATTFACVNIGTAPADCPSGWPFDPGRTPKYVVSQGPNGSFSHRGLEAVDIAIPLYTGVSEIVHSTHQGTVVERGTSSSGAKYVRISGQCNGAGFTSSHWHLAVIYDSIIVGTKVTRGTPLGIAGNTGVCAFNPDCIPGRPGREHDHYQFGLKNNSTLQMSSPYIPIPDDSLRGCVGIPDCNFSLP